MATLKELVNETTNIKNKLNTCHKNLKNNLENNGVACSDTDKMSDLVEKVNNIEIPAQRVSIADTANKYTATNVEDALKEVKTKVDNGQNVKITEDNGACRGIPSNDANNIETTGVWMGSNVANAPQVEHAWVYIESKVHNDLYQIQIATDLHNSEKRWTRHKTSGTWSEWREL